MRRISFALQFLQDNTHLGYKADSQIGKKIRYLEGLKESHESIMWPVSVR